MEAVLVCVQIGVASRVEAVSHFLHYTLTWKFWVPSSHYLGLELILAAYISNLYGQCYGRFVRQENQVLYNTVTL